MPGTSPQNTGGQERIVRIETQIGYILSEQSSIRQAQEKVAIAVESLTRQSDSQSNIALAIRDTLKVHELEIETLQASQADTSKLIVLLDSKVSQIEKLLKYVGGPILTLIIGYLASHFLK